MDRHRLNASFWPSTAALLVFLPWINPWSDFPAPMVLPLLANVVCSALLMGVIAFSGMTRQVLWWSACSAWLVAAEANTLFALLQYFDLAGPFHPWINEIPPDQIFGNLRQRNLFASLCAMGLTVLNWRMTSSSRLLTTGRVLAAALLGLGLAISSSRTGLIEVALLWVLALVWRDRGLSNPLRWRQQFKVLQVATVAYFLAAWLLPLLTSRNETALTRLLAGEGGCLSRRVLWENMWELVLQKPWLGWGWGHVGYAHFITDFKGPRFCGLVDNAHNLPLHLAVTLGLPVAMLVVVLVIFATCRAKPWKVTDAGQQLAWTVLALISLHSLLEYPLWYEEFQFAFFLCLWYLRGRHAQALTKGGWLKSAVWPATKARALALAIGACLLLASALVYGSYARVRLLWMPSQFRPAHDAASSMLQARDIVLFTYEVSLAQSTVDLTMENAQSSLDLAVSLLHAYISPFSLERAIAASRALGRTNEANFYELRYQAVFPIAYYQWIAADKKSKFFSDKTAH